VEELVQASVAVSVKVWRLPQVPTFCTVPGTHTGVMFPLQASPAVMPSAATVAQVGGVGLQPAGCRLSDSW
jgi:hypothetical protein